MLSSLAALAQSREVTGVVTDDSNQPLPGVAVVVPGTTIGTVTDFDGKYTINVDDAKQLSFSFIGFETQTLDIVGNSVNAQMVSDTKELDDVVVVGYGVQKKKLVTGATVEVKGDDIQKMSTTQVLGALQSQTPGVSIQSNSGQPGDGFKISIRGAGTNGSTDPLYVIDGVSGGDINNINPADIERIDVLKDAASCAIYGSAAANGVILVTTKRGKAGDIQVTYDGTIGWSNVYRLPQMLTAKQYMEVQDQMAFNSGSDVFDWSKYVDAEILEAYKNGSNSGTDWVDEIRNKNAMTTTHAINMSGGSDRSTFSFGAGYQYQDGVFGNIVKSDFRRFTLRLNSDHVLWRGDDGRDIIKVGENLYYSHKQNQGIQIGNQYSNALSTMLRANPLVPVYDKDGNLFDNEDINNFGSEGIKKFNSYTSNPILTLVNRQSGNNKSVNYTMNLTAYIDVQPIKDLVYHGQVNYNRNTNTYRNYEGVFNANDTNADTFITEGNDKAQNQIGTGWSWGTTNTLSYKFTAGAANHFDVMVGSEFGQSKPDFGFSLTATATNSVFGDFKHAYMSYMKNRTNAATVSGEPYADTRTLSFFGRVNYDFSERYMLSAIFRGDGNSKFAPGERWGFFPSVSAGWVVSNEGFMESASWLDFLKIRAGWGQNGNAGSMANFQWASAYEFNSNINYSFGNQMESQTSGARVARPENKDLTWETSEQTNIGFDARFLDSRLGLTFDWYNKKTKDLLVTVPADATTGFDSKWANAGTIENKGIEVALNWHDNITKDFSYSVGYNIAYNKNEVTKINSSQKYINGGNDLLSQGTGYIARFEEGHPIGYFWGYKTAGVMQDEKDVQDYLVKNCGGSAANSLQGTGIQPGDLKFVDVNGDGKIDADDKTELGDPNPDVTMGVNLGVTWKFLDLNIVGFSALGQQVARSYRKFADGNQENFTTEVYSYWNGKGTSDKYPRFARMNAGPNWQQISDIYIEDADYFRLQNLTLGCDITKIVKMPIQQLRVYFTAQNLFTITDYKGMDPECGKSLNDDEPWVTGVDVGNYPQPRTYLVGVNVKF